MVSFIAGSFIGLVLGGILGPIDWRLVFLISVPVGVVGTIWGIVNLKEHGVRTPAKIDWLGNICFGVGLISLPTGIVYGIEPYAGHSMGWSNPLVLTALFGGAFVLALFVWVETKVAEPMFHIQLFRIRAFSSGSVASLMASLGRGGLMFILVIWLQGIWLPEHGYSFARTPLWAGIFMLPLSAGFLVAAPLAGYLSDHYGSRPFAVGGMVFSAVSFALMAKLPINFSYVWFALLLFANGLASGLFASPNRAALMNAIPPDQRGQASGMSSTTMNSATVLSMGIFFTLIIVGLAGYLPHALYHGLITHGVPSAAAHHVANLPPGSSVFAAFLGINPIKNLLGAHGVLAALPHVQATFLTGRAFFPSLIAGPFAHGLHTALYFAAAASLLAAIAAAMMGKQYIYREVAGGDVAPVSRSVPTPPADELQPLTVSAVSLDGLGGDAPTATHGVKL
jgi:MFS family permease